MSDMIAANLPVQSVPCAHLSDAWPDLLVQLADEFKPESLIERMWLRDIAVLTTRIDHLRLIQSGVHSFHMHRLSQGAEAGQQSGNQVPAQTPEWTSDPQEHAAVQKIVSALEAIGERSICDFGPAFERLLGMVYTERLSIFVELDRLMVDLLRSRDLIIEIFEKRRCDVATMKALSESSGADAAMKLLQEQSGQAGG